MEVLGHLRNCYLDLVMVAERAWFLHSCKVDLLRVKRAVEELLDLWPVPRGILRWLLWSVNKLIGEM